MGWSRKQNLLRHPSYPHSTGISLLFLFVLFADLALLVGPQVPEVYCLPPQHWGYQCRMFYTDARESQLRASHLYGKRFTDRTVHSVLRVLFFHLHCCVGLLMEHWS